MRCPVCRQVGTFDSSGKDTRGRDSNGNNVNLGHRRCPNPDCRTHVFIVQTYNGDALVCSYPPETIDFDASNLPKAVLESLDEAVRCHASQCYRAAALHGQANA